MIHISALLGEKLRFKGGFVAPYRTTDGLHVVVVDTAEHGPRCVWGPVDDALGALHASVAVFDGANQGAVFEHGEPCVVGP